MTMTPTNAIALLVCGTLWGWSFASSHVNEFILMRAQFTLTSHVMLKTFLAALTFSTLSFLVLSYSSEVGRKAQLESIRANSNRRDGRGLLFVRTQPTSTIAHGASVQCADAGYFTCC